MDYRIWQAETMQRKASLLEGTIEASIEKEELGDIEEAIERLAVKYASPRSDEIAQQAAQSAQTNALVDAELAQQIAQIELQLSGGGSPMNNYTQVNNASGVGVPNLCPPGSYYDPVHQICQPNLTSTPEGGYGQVCPDGYVYDPVHGVCTNHMTPTPPPYFPR